ncbi:glycosyltransferase family 2 protein [Butyrivibrio sp. MC2013]|uniref:glycosyltransferase family 2 protein n=1 Tax=Butyrivibrio sp. MC2013 TaxID=1280686 RepID=UPI0004045868|nr:glycosyltransferase family 2 protein [Butyrivibrio sp. MC2013]
MISVVMPVFNTAPYLNDTIQGIIDQSFIDWELICVDDGSTDESLMILRRFMSIDKRIKVLSQCNQGAAAARNYGLMHSFGEYIIFLDSDDSFSKYFLEIMYNGIKTADDDICICGYTSSGTDIDYYKKPICIPDGSFRLQDLGDDGFSLCRLNPWNKLIKKSLIDDNQIVFQSLQSSNDVCFSLRVLSEAKSICFINDFDLIIHRTDRAGQISENRCPSDLLKAINEYIQKTTISDDSMSRKTIDITLRASIYELRRCPSFVKKESYYRELREFIRSNGFIFDKASETQKKQIQLFMENDVNSYWWELNNICQMQLSQYPEIIELLSSYKYVVLWGCGKRGDSFLSYIKSAGIKVTGITDIDINKAKQLSLKYYENDISITQEQALSQSDCIIAANNTVYHYLYSIKYKGHLIDLEKYCNLI